MSVVEVARKDFLDVRRSLVIWLVMVTFAGFAGALMLLQTDQLRWYETTRAGVVGVLQGVVTLGALLIPIVALVAAYLAIAGERETGSLKFVLGLPNTRRDIILGKFLSRSLVNVLGILSAGLVVAGVLLLAYPLFPVVPFLVMFGLLALYALVYTSIAIGVSATVASKARAAAAGFGLYFVLNVLPVFRSLGGMLRTVHVDLLGFAEAPVLYQIVSLLVPMEALFYGVSVVAEPVGSVTDVPPDAPFYVQPEFAPVILSTWVVLPIAVGYYNFKTANVD